MLSESMLQKFTTKIEQLVSSNYIIQQPEPSRNQISIYNKTKKLYNNNNDVKKKIRNDNNPNTINIVDASDSEQSNCNNQQSDGSQYNSSAMNLDEDRQNPVNSKVNNKEIHKPVVFQKQKNQANTRSNTTQPSPIKKTPSLVPTPKQSTQSITKPPGIPTTTTSNRPTFQMPKVSVMNNLIKLSTKISAQDILKQIKYQSLMIAIAPIRFLLYFCIEKIIYYMYESQGIAKMQQKLRPVAFVEKQIQIALLKLLGYIKITQRTMVSRILRGVFNRLEIPHIYSQKWLTQCIQLHKDQISKIKIDADELMKMPTSNNITSNIFIGVGNIEKKINYDYTGLQLEDENESKQVIDDPEVLHAEQKLFFFKKPLIKRKENIKKSSQSTKNERVLQKDQVDLSENYETKQFKIQLKKIKLPQNVVIVTNSHNSDELDVYKALSPPTSTQINDCEIVSGKRTRSQFIRNLSEERKIVEPSPPLTKSQIISLIQQYFDENIQQICNKIAKKWQINPRQIKNLIKQTTVAKSAPTKMIPESRSQRNKEKPKTEDDVVRQISAKAIHLQKAGVSHKQLVKQIFKILESQDMTHEQKQSVMDKWIFIKKQRQAMNRTE